MACVATLPLPSLRAQRQRPASGARDASPWLADPPPPLRPTARPPQRERGPLPNLQHFTQKVTFMKLTGDRNQCPTCSEHFNSSRAFDKHRVGKHGADRRCLTPMEMRAQGMAKNAAGFWVGSVMDRERLERIAA